MLSSLSDAFKSTNQWIGWWQYSSTGNTTSIYVYFSWSFNSILALSVVVFSVRAKLARLIKDSMENWRGHHSKVA